MLTHVSCKDWAIFLAFKSELSNSSVYTSKPFRPSILLRQFQPIKLLYKLLYNHYQVKNQPPVGWVLLEVLVIYLPSSPVYPSRFAAMCPLPPPVMERKLGVQRK